MTDRTVSLFSYGTLQNKDVQFETFGRALVGYQDELLHYTLEMLEIKDESVVALSGASHHPMAVAKQGARITGTVFEITAEELTQSDQYEVDDYQRVLGEMASGKFAWVYASAKHK